MPLLLLYVLYATAENPNAHSWVIETVGTSRKDAFPLNKNSSILSFTTKSRLILRPNLPLIDCGVTLTINALYVHLSVFVWNGLRNVPSDRLHNHTLGNTFQVNRQSIRSPSNRRPTVACDRYRLAHFEAYRGHVRAEK